MRSRFFGASSYDDDEDDEEDMDLSGFVTSSETQPVVVERKRATTVKPSESDQMFGRSGATNPSNMGNAGPKTTPPPPMSNMGRMYTPTYEVSPGGDGSINWSTHLKPLYASDMSSEATAKASVLMKTGGLSLICLGIVTQLATSYQKIGATMGIVGAASYVHPVLGLRHGMLAELAGNKSPTFTTIAAFSTNVAGAGIFAKGLTKVSDGKFPSIAPWRTIAGAGAVGVGGLALIRKFR